MRRTESGQLPSARSICNSFAACLLAGWTMLAASRAVALDPVEARWRCPYNPDGACAPSRATWGYYPTRWHQWPDTPLTPAGSRGISAPKASPAQRPAGERTAPSTESPQLPETDNAPPLDTNRTQEPPDQESTPANPASPNKELESTPFDSTVPSDSSAPSNPSDAAPTPPVEEDPFKDEPPGSTKPASQRSGGTEKKSSMRPADTSLGQVQWRPTHLFTVRASALEPEMLPPVIAPVEPVAAADEPGSLPFPTSNRVNPLRSAPAAPSGNRVTPTSAWMAQPMERSEAPVLDARVHSNPLRPR